MWVEYYLNRYYCYFVCILNISDKFRVFVQLEINHKEINEASPSIIALDANFIVKLSKYSNALKIIAPDCEKLFANLLNT